MSRSPDPFLLPGNSAAKGSPAPKGRNIPAQGNALGPRPTTNLSPEGAAQGVMPMIPLGQIAEVKLGKMLDKSKHTTGKKFPYLRNINVRWGRIDTSDLSEMFFKESEAERFSVNPGDVLVCEGGEPGRAAVWKGDHTHLKYQKALHRVRFLHEYDPRLLLYYLELLASRGALESRFTGSTIKHFTREAFIQLPVPNPPLPEQRRIVARIEELFSRLDAGVAALRQAKAQLRRYRQSVLAAAVTGQLTQAWREQHPETEPAEELLERILEQRREQWGGRGKYKEPLGNGGENPFATPPSWALTNFEQVSRRVTVGDVGSMKDEYTESGVPFLRGQNVRANRFDANGLKFVSREFHLSLSKSLIRGGDIAVTRSGDVGIACVIPEELGEANCSDLVLIQGPVLINPNFAAYYMNSLGRRLVQQGKVGVAITYFNTQAVAAMPLPLPPIAEQHQIVAEVEARTTAIDHLEAELDRQITRSNRLRQSTLAAAFSGQF